MSLWVVTCAVAKTQSKHSGLPLVAPLCDGRLWTLGPHPAQAEASASIIPSQNWNHTPLVHFKSGQLLGPLLLLLLFSFLTHGKNLCWKILLRCHSTRWPLDGAAVPVSHNNITYVMMFVEETNPPKASSKNARTKQLHRENMSNQN